MLTREDYKLWSVMTAEQFSENGKWCSYSLRYESGMDTLFVKRTDGKTTFAFPKGNNGMFNGEKWFACLNDQKTLTVYDLKKGNSSIIENVARFQWIGHGNYLLVLQNDGKGSTSISIRGLDGIEVHRIEHVDTYKVSPSGMYVAFTSVKDSTATCGIINAGKTVSSKVLFSSNASIAEQPVWENSDKAFAFVERMAGNADDMGKLHTYDVGSANLSTLDPSLSSSMPDGVHISPNVELISISPDLRRVFFGLKQNSDRAFVVDPNAVQIWNTTDKYLYPLKIEVDGFNVVDKVAVWFKDSGQFRQITDNAMPRLSLNASGTYAIIHNPVAYEPQQRFYGNVDYYLTNIETGERELLLQDFAAGEFRVVFSPDGRYISYSKHRNWWSYDIHKKTHTNLTTNIQTVTDNEANDWPEAANSYSRPMWSSDGKYFLFYDQFDIWKVTPDGKSFSRLTSGRERTTSFRFEPQAAHQQSGRYYDSGRSAEFDLAERLYIVGRDKVKGSNGYYLWTAKNGIVPLVLGEKEFDPLKTTANGDCLFVEQKYDAAPSLWFKKYGGKARKVFQSNPQQDQFYWGKSELIRYSNKKGRKLGGLLFYPADYQPGQKYPMLVEVYQRQGRDLHKYVNPSEYTRNGFNVTNFTSRGYFVLLPDMYYEIGDPGLSAVDCTLAAVKAVQQIAAIDDSRIGLSGHSFGGYEVNFIITQSALFKAAVSGSGMSDLNSVYLDYSRNYSRPEMWRFEYESLRIGKSIFEAKADYDRNSPVIHAPLVKTPLLLWTGGNDTQVNPQQSLEFHLALKRLGKENVFLIYPNEDHTIHGRRNQFDLTLKIEDWFDYYLKDKPVPNWTKPDFVK